MQEKDTILNELLEISPAVANIHRRTIYIVPMDYFESLPAEILSRIRLENAVGGIKTLPYTAPNGYFQDFSKKMLLKIKAENQWANNDLQDELQDIAPLLNSLDRKPIYSLPEGYFDSVTVPITNIQPAKVVSFSKWRRMVNYAVAAVFTGVLAIGAIKFMAPSAVKNFHDEVSKTSDEELKEIVKNHSVAPYSLINTSSDDQEGTSIFEGTSEDELSQYLKERPETAEKSNMDI
jgi:hypothetical protein